MKNFLNALLSTSFLLLALTGCPSPNNSNNANPQLSGSPSSTPSVTPSSIPSVISSVKPSGNYTKANVIVFLNCIKTKNPDLVLAMDAHIANVNAMSDSQWNINSGAYSGIEQIYSASTGCKI